MGGRGKKKKIATSEKRPLLADMGESEIPLPDKFGFLVDKSDIFQKCLPIPAEEIARRQAKDIERTRKWKEMEFSWNTIGTQIKVKSRVRKGIPDGVRRTSWARLTEALPRYEEEVPNLNILNTASLSPIVIDEIERDVDRTFPRHVLFYEENGVGQSALRRLLQRYALLNTDVGYCQGMGFIAGMLLIYMPENTATYCFMAALNEPKYNLRVLYLPGMIAVKKALLVVSSLLTVHMGPLWEHLTEEGISPTMFATEWVMTLFCRGFSFDLATRVWEIFLQSGFKVVYRVMLALLQNVSAQLMAASFEEIMAILRKLPDTVDAPALIQIAMALPLRRSEIAHFEAEAELAVREEEAAAVSGGRR